MSLMILFGPPPSSYVRTARMACAEKGVDHVLEPLDLGSEAHRKMHPWCRVPVARHGEVQLIETSAICRYIDAAFDGPRLVPQDPRAAARMETWISAINCYIYDDVIRNYALQYVIPAMKGESPNRKVIDENLPKLTRDFGLLDAAYAEQPWLAGDALSLADLFVAPIVATVAHFPEGKAALESNRNLARSFARLVERRSFEAAHAGL